MCKMVCELTGGYCQRATENAEDFETPGPVCDPGWQNLDDAMKAFNERDGFDPRLWTKRLEFGRTTMCGLTGYTIEWSSRKVFVDPSMS